MPDLEQNIIKIFGTSDAPTIVIDKNNHHLKISGYAYPEDPHEVFAPVFQWVQGLLDSHYEGPVLVELYFSVLSSSANRTFFELIHLLNQLHLLYQNVTLTWYYDDDDDDMRDEGVDLADTTKLKINIVPIENQVMVEKFMLDKLD